MEKTKLFILGLQCKECGFNVAIGSSFEEHVKHLHEDIEEQKYDGWTKFDYPLVDRCIFSNRTYKITVTGVT